MTQDVPVITQSGNSYRFEWKLLGIEALVRRIHVYSGYTNAEVTWYSTSPGEKGHLYQGILRLLDARSKSETARTLKLRHSEKDWAATIEQLAVRTLELHRRGEPSVLLATSSDAARPLPVAIEPLFYEGQPFILFGEPGTAKSYIALLLLAAGVLGQPIHDTPFRPLRAYTGLYLDWESTQRDQQQRLRRIGHGLGVDLNEKLHYRYCSAPLAHDIDQIQGVLLDTQADLLVVDSLGPAAGGDLNSSQSAQDFFSALRNLKCTTIILAHCAKNSDSKRRSVFGSQFFTALTRGTAEVKRYQEAGENVVSVGIYHRKSNVSRLERPFGLQLTFDEENESVTVRNQEIQGIAELETSLPVRQRIAALLTSSGCPLATADIISALDDVKAATVRQALKRMAERSEAIRVSAGVYSAATQEGDSGVPF
jgi:hypothetical protein